MKEKFENGVPSTEEKENPEEELTEAELIEAKDLLSRLKNNRWIKAFIKEMNNPFDPEALNRIIFDPVIKSFKEFLRKKTKRN